MDTSRRWSVRGLAGSWVAYWLILGGIKLGPAIAAIWRASHATGNDSSVTVSVRDWVIGLGVTQHGATTWSGAAHLGVLALWIGAGPLALWVLWLATASRRRPEESARVGV